MALVVADDRLLAAPDQRDGAAQLPGGEREQMLDREVFAPTEGPADGGVAHDHLLFGQLEHRGDLAAVLVQPLPRRLDDHAALLVDIGDAGLGLQEGVLLPGGLELAFEDDVGLGEAARDVALADGDVQQQVRAELFVDQRRVGSQRGARIGHGGQVFVLDLDELRAPASAASCVSATTSATLSPAKRTTSPQRTGWSASIRPKALYGTSRR